MSKLSCIVFCAIAMRLCCVFVASEDASSVFHDVIKPLIDECAEEYKLNGEELKKVRGPDAVKKLPPCFIGCVLKKFDIINDKGLYDAEAGLATIKTLLPNKEYFEKLSAVLKECTSVNKKSVSDGDAGCERAVLATMCYMEHKTAIIA